jgi:peroxiredoxin
LIAISADPPADGALVATQMKLTYPILSDNSRNYIRQYNVLHPQEGIARPAMFVIDKAGRIIWSYVGADASDRPDMSSVLQRLQSVK